MNEVSRQFLDLAKRNAVEYVVNPNVAAIVVTGSVARGTADESSDIDMLVFIHEKCTREEFQYECERANKSGGRLYGGSPDEGFALFHFVDGVRFDVVFDLVSTMEKRIEQVMVDFSTDEQKQLLIRSIHEANVLYGGELVKSWRCQTANYPDGLAQAMAEKNLNAPPLWILRKMGAERAERLFLYDFFIYNIPRIFAVLCGINRVYHPAKLKGISRIVDEFSIAPNRFLERCEGIFDLTLGESVDEFERLVNETYDLIDEHLPSVDTNRAREIFHMKLGRPQPPECGQA